MAGWACVVGGVHGSGACMEGWVACMVGACMAGGHAWWGACVAGDMHGKGEGMHGKGACVGEVHGRGACVAGE